MPDSARKTNPIADAFSHTSAFFARRTHMAPMNEIVTVATHAYLDAIDPTDCPSPASIETQLLVFTNGICRAESEKAGSTKETHPIMRYLTAWQLAKILLRLHHVVRIVFASTKGTGALGIYATDGPDLGTFVIDEEELRKAARKYNTQLTLREFTEVLAVLNEDAVRTSVCYDRDLIGLNNGIFDYRTKTLHPFDPSIVLLAKIRVNYIDLPTNPIITRDDGTTWDVEYWLNSLSDDPERVGLGWHVLGAVIRPNVRWNKAVMLFNETGNNGKGTFQSLCRNLVGLDSWASLSIADFENKFRLPEIVNKVAFGADENDVDAFTEKMASFKSVVTGDTVMVERKHKDPYAYVPRGLIIQCLNSLPKFKDTSGSNYRRFLFWPFDKNFAIGEDKAIKADYLTRQEVLEYVLWRVLSLPDFYELPEPQASAAILAEFKEHNDPVREFWIEVENQLVWHLQPQEFLHDLFISWSERTNPRGGGLKRRVFYNRLKAIVAETGRWEDGQWGTSSLMDDAELLIAKFELRRWMDPMYSGSNPASKSRPVLEKKYRGLRRIGYMRSTRAHPGGRDIAYDGHALKDSVSID